ncbi:GntR family transcriptional regulator [Brevibacterium casei]|uniref:GntR family transcriptional regulator n=1 Tax=Brevibacterium casei TaxID=33889 RepID=UPI00191B1D15|nr:GntR family transcriptional regulator [Brevibacterium casei]QQT68559.1 GntR family transcriptional regulator [Brevibacterium casei]
MRGFRPTKPERTDTQSTAARVHAELRRRIVHGELAAGAALSENGLAAEFSVSRTPVREVLRELITEGLLEVGRRRQNIVTAHTPERARELSLMLGALGDLVAGEAPRVLEHGDADILHLILIRTEREITAGRFEGAVDGFDDFLVEVTELADLPVVADTMRRLCAHARLAGLGVPASPEALSAHVTMLRTLAEAVEAGDREAARVTMGAITSARGTARDDRPGAAD